MLLMMMGPFSSRQPYQPAFPCNREEKKDYSSDCVKNKRSSKNKLSVSFIALKAQYLIKRKNGILA